MNDTFKKIVMTASVVELTKKVAKKLAKKISDILEGHNSYVGITVLSSLCAMLCKESEMDKETYMFMMSRAWDAVDKYNLKRRNK